MDSLSIVDLPIQNVQIRNETINNETCDPLDKSEPKDHKFQKGKHMPYLATFTGQFNLQDFF